MTGSGIGSPCREQRPNCHRKLPVSCSPRERGPGSARPKALAEFHGEPLADRGARLLRDGGAAPVIVVTGAVTVKLAEDLADVIVAHNQAWRGGMGSSLAVGLAPFPPLQVPRWSRWSTSHWWGRRRYGG